MQGPLRYLGYAAAGLVLGGTLSSACASETSDGVGGAGNVGGMAGGTATGGTSVTGGSGGTGATDASTGGGINIDGSLSDGAINPDAACDLQTYQATITKKPVDVIFIVDNSCSMDAEMEGIEKNINQNFAQIIAGSGLDFRVILIGEHGEPKAPSSYESSLCIGPPLGGAPCDNVPQNTAPKNNPPVFYHYDHDDVESWDAWCKMADWYTKPDRYNLALGGWKEWLRLEALKTFVVVSDDRVDCMWPSTSTYYSSCSTPGPKCYDDTSSAQTAAQQFDQDLLALDSAQFGTAQNRNYVWHSIVGVAANSGSPTGAYEPTDPMVASSTKCSSAVNSGPGHQALSILTGGLRFPVCDGLGFDAVFKKIAEGVIKGAKIQCDFAMPEAPAGKELDPKTIQILYTPGNGLPPEKFTQVADASQCAPGSFYIESASDAGDAAGADGGTDKIVLCPAACSEVQADDKANVQILALCKTGGPI